MKTILVAGLGNPGNDYKKTRHNAGFMFLDHFWTEFGGAFAFSDWKPNKKLRSEISIGKKAGTKIILIKPQTFMNLSGEAVAAAAKYYKIDPQNINVAHDDIDLKLGKYKISRDCSSAGHNGVQNIIDLLGTKDFTRLRIGVENRGEKNIPTEKYVLAKFTTAEIKKIGEVFNSADWIDILF